MKFKGTKGKWYIGEHREIGIQIGCDQSHYVACAYAGGSDRSSDEILANAQLIACAPELLDIANKLRRELDILFTLCGNRIEAKRYNELIVLLNQSYSLINQALGKEVGNG